MVQIVNPLTIVKQGGGPTPPTPEPLDPQVVYQQTRPADWLPMPTPADNEIYLLAQVPVPNQEKDPGTPLAFLCNTSAGQYQVELGTVENGAFVVDSTYTTLVDSNTKYTNYLYYADWVSHPMADGTHQVMVKISTVSGNLTTFGGAHHIGGRNYPNGTVLEFRGHAENITQCYIGSSYPYVAWTKLAYFSLEGLNRISTNFASMFYGCYSLTAIPELDTSSGTNFQSMFGNCYSLTAIPELDTSSGTNFSNMFYGCSSLTAIPELDTSSGTNFGNMFSSCYSLTAIPELDTSSGTSFSNMFGNCYSLTAIPELDTSSGTNFYQMFVSCYSLTAIPELDTSSGTSFYQMFSNCYSLTAIPQLDTSSGTDFYQMFQGCYSLTAIPELDTSSGTNFQGMFQGCYSLRYVDFTGYDFTHAISSANGSTALQITGDGIMRIDSTWKWASGNFSTTQITSSSAGSSASAPFYVLIEDDQTMVALGANATTVFTTNQYTYVVVPDSMYATYAADTYWAPLGARLKRRSDVTLPDWYTA